MKKIAPSLLSADFTHLSREVLDVTRAGADYLHLDVMDGVFVPNISFGLPVIRAIRPLSQIVFDVHLMIVQPEKYIEAFVKAGADLITFHIEATEDVAATIDKIKTAGIRCGVSVKPHTPVERLYPYLDSIDLALIMTVEPGFGGQKLIPETLEKIKQLRAEIDRRASSVEIQADGGVNRDNAASVFAAGADTLVAGTAVFGAPDRREAIAALRI